MNHQNCANQHNNNLTKRTDSTKKGPNYGKYEKQQVKHEIAYTHVHV